MGSIGITARTIEEAVARLREERAQPMGGEYQAVIQPRCLPQLIHQDPEPRLEPPRGRLRRREARALVRESKRELRRWENRHRHLMGSVSHLEVSERMLWKRERLSGEMGQWRGIPLMRQSSSIDPEIADAMDYASHVIAEAVDAAMLTEANGGEPPTREQLEALGLIEPGQDLLEASDLEARRDELDEDDLGGGVKL